jgi:hypothetical protein
MRIRTPHEQLVAAADGRCNTETIGPASGTRVTTVYVDDHYSIGGIEVMESLLRSATKACVTWDDVVQAVEAPTCVRTVDERRQLVCGTHAMVVVADGRLVASHRRPRHSNVEMHGAA